MNNIQSVLKIHTRDKWSWLYIPALILFSSFFVNLAVSYTINSQENTYTGGILSIFIYIFVLGILAMVQTFPFALGMSVRRRDYFIGTSVMGISSSIVIGILVYLFALIETNTDGWGSYLHFFHFPYLNDGTPLEQIVTYIILLTFFFFLGFTISSFSRRFGKKGMWISAFTVLVLGSIVLLLLHQYNVWIDIFLWITRHTAVQLAFWLIPFVFIYACASYLLIRRSTI